jgi:hypothetical protein
MVPNRNSQKKMADLKILQCYSVNEKRVTKSPQLHPKFWWGMDGRSGPGQVVEMLKLQPQGKPGSPVDDRLATLAAPESRVLTSLKSSVEFGMTDILT